MQFSAIACKLNLYGTVILRNFTKITLIYSVFSFISTKLHCPVWNFTEICEDITDWVIKIVIILFTKD